MCCSEYSQWNHIKVYKISIIWSWTTMNRLNLDLLASVRRKKMKQKSSTSASREVLESPSIAGTQMSKKCGPFFYTDNRTSTEIMWNRFFLHCTTPCSFCHVKKGVEIPVLDTDKQKERICYFIRFDSMVTTIILKFTQLQNITRRTVLRYLRFNRKKKYTQ